MVHGGRCAWAVGNQMLAFGTILGVPVCVEIVLSYVQPPNCGCLFGGLDLRGWLVVDGVGFGRFVRSPWGRRRFSKPFYIPFHRFGQSSNVSCVSNGLQLLVIYDVLPGAALNPYEYGITPSGHC